VFCRKCGAQNDDDAYKCASCGDVIQSLPPKQINNFLAPAIVVTVLCCLPFGIVGIVYAAQVNARAQGGDVAGAEDCARKAKIWTLWGLGIGLSFWILYGGLMLIGVVAGSMAQ